MYKALQNLTSNMKKILIAVGAGIIILTLLIIKFVFFNNGIILLTSTENTANLKNNIFDTYNIKIKKKINYPDRKEFIKAINKNNDNNVALRVIYPVLTADLQKIQRKNFHYFIYKNEKNAKNELLCLNKDIPNIEKFLPKIQQDKNITPMNLLEFKDKPKDVYELNKIINSFDEANKKKKNNIKSKDTDAKNQDSEKNKEEENK